MQQLVTDHDINVLLYNVQTVTPVTTQIRALARQHGIPVVGVSETMPAGVATYQQWQQRQLDRAAARARAQPQPVTPATTSRGDTNAPATPPIELRDAAVQLGGRTLWSDLDLDVGPGEFLAVLGPNGTGKTTLLKVLLGLVPLSAGTVRVHGRPPRRGNPELGYVPQQQRLRPSLPIRGRDLVRFGVGRPPLGRAAAQQPGHPGPGRRRSSRRWARAPTPTRRSASSRAASSSACASPRPSSATRPCCCATSPSWPSTWPASAPSPDSSTSAASAPARPSSSSPTRSTPSCPTSTASCTWSAGAGPSAPPARS